ncbi:MAG TPA: site-specific integrase [Candidatus Angelobacter sp.]
MLKIRLAEITSGTFAGPQIERVQIEDLADDFLRDYRINGKKSLDDVQTRWNLHLKPFFGFLRAVDVTSDLLARYVDARQGEGAKNATINRELAAIKRMFHLGMKATPTKVTRIPAFPHLAENNVRKGFLEDGQYQKLIGYCPELWFRSIVECGRTYGWRISEVLNLRVNQVDTAHRVIRLEPGTTKNKSGREVVMTEAVYQLLSACIFGKSADDFVFTRPNGKPVRDFRITWENACSHTGVPNLLFHDLRRTAARNLRRIGIGENVIMRIGGWKTRSVFQRYDIVDNRDIADAMKKLEDSEKGQIGHVLVTFGDSAKPHRSNPANPQVH